MSFINGSPLAGSFNGSPLAGSNGSHQFAFEPTQNEAGSQSDIMRPTNTWSDGFRPTPISLPIDNPGYGYGNGNGNGNGNSSGGTANGSTDSNSFFSGIMQSLSNLMSQISALFGQSNGSNGTTSGNGSTSGNGYANSQPQYQAQENAFTNATASSWGDPHDTFDGTTTAGKSVSGSWDSMKSHSDLLDSDSFRGGYQASTTTTTPDANGVTYNASATVATHDGNDAVTLNKDGSYAVTENGQNVTLAQGQATQIGRNESVTLNSDKSLTIVDTNRQGGSLTTTLSDNGNGVDVKASGTNVDLGGYLVNKSDQSAPNPVSYQPYGGNGYNAGGYQALGSGYNIGGTTSQNPYEYGSDTEPLGAGEIEFA